MSIRIFLISILACLLYGCLKENSTNIEGKDDLVDYTGLKIGNTIFYHVKHIFHDDQVDRHDTTEFKMKSEIQDTFRDNENNLRYLIHRFRWNDTINNWVSYKVISAYKKTNFYFESEDNLLTKKLYIPYILNMEWNAYTHTNNDSLHYRYLVNYPFIKINNIQVDSVIHVKQQLYKTYVDLKRKSEFYAKNKGLIYRVYKDLQIKKGDTLKIEKGVEWYYSIYQFLKGK